MKKEDIENIVVLIVTIVWGLTYLLDPIFATLGVDWEPNPSVGVAMTSIIGVILAAKAYRRGKNGNGNGSS